MKYRRRWAQRRIAICSLGFVGAVFLLWQLIGMQMFSSEMNSNILKAKQVYENTIKEDIDVITTEFPIQRKMNLLLGSRANDMIHYRPQDGKFRCMMTGLQIPFENVNDDFCDCTHDGSDEPGTSACSQSGVFFCTYHQRANKPDVWVPSSKVNDGICDCCDGSDEWKNVTLPTRFKLSDADQRRMGVYQVPCTFTCF